MPFCPSVRVWSRLVVGVALTVASTVAAALVWVPADAAGTADFVAPNGADTNSGASAAAPFRTMQKALDHTQRGERRRAIQNDPEGAGRGPAGDGDHPGAREVRRGRRHQGRRHRLRAD